VCVRQRDEYGNARTSATDGALGAFHVRVLRANRPLHHLTPFPPSVPTAPDARISLPTTKAALSAVGGDGRVQGQYMIPAEPWDDSITPLMLASWAQPGGLHATYYTTAEARPAGAAHYTMPPPCETAHLPRLHQRVALPMANLTHPGGGDADLRVALASCAQATQAGARVLVRYHGLLSACEPAPALCPAASFFQRTFNWTVAPSDRVKLWVDNALLIDQWTSLSSTSVSASHRFLDRNAALDIAAYLQRDLNTSAPMRLEDDGDLAANATIATTRLLYVSDLSGSPFALTLP
jgi:hypothetical protein